MTRASSRGSSSADLWSHHLTTSGQLELEHAAERNRQLILILDVADAQSSALGLQGVKESERP